MAPASPSIVEQATVSCNGFRSGCPEKRRAAAPGPDLAQETEGSAAPVDLNTRSSD